MRIDKFKRDDGWYEIDGISYPNAEAVLGNRIGFCGCGDPESALAYVGMVLIAAHERKMYDKWDELFGNDGRGYFILYMLDDKGLIEHGTSIGSSWLTDKGKELLNDILELYPPN